MATEAAAAPSNPFVQYVVIRKDLGQGMGWPLGSICAQAAHAALHGGRFATAVATLLNASLCNRAPTKSDTSMACSGCHR